MRLATLVTGYRRFSSGFRSVPILLSATILVACSAAEDAIRAANIEAVKLQHSEVWSKGNVSIIPQIYAEDFVAHAPGGKLIRGHEGIKTMVESHRRAFPDWNEKVERILAEGEFVVTLFRSTGTHEGLFQRYPATGKRIEITETCIYRLDDGRIVEQWIYPDIASLQNQLSGNAGE
jgi:steroid delta-isomerase-like uncharacterized protein